MLARHVSNEDYNIQGEVLMQNTAKVLLSALDEINTQCKKMTWNAPRSDSAMQAFPSHNIHFMSNWLTNPI